MYRADRQSTRLLFDLQACQTVGSAHRGVGRFSRSLFKAIAAVSAPRDLRVLLSDTLSLQPRDLPVSEDRILRLTELPDWNSDRDFLGGDRDSLDALAYSSLLQRVSPDVVHVSHAFEGLVERVPLPNLAHRTPGQIFSATLYDLIPLVFQSQYFALPGLKPWYLARMAWLRQADLLLAISESTRQDAINLLGIEPWRVVTILGGIGKRFAPPGDGAAARRELAARYSLRGEFVLYTGGDDFRKNIEGAIKGFAELSPELRATRQLVILCALSDERKRHFQEFARTCGLDSGRLVLPGFVPESDLVAFYGACELFVFPSLYEGLGLPVLEAMACGAPTIGGDNSSIREIIGREDALFEAGSTAAIAKRMTDVLTNPAFAADLRRYGLQRAGDFNWERSARSSLEAIDESLARVRRQGVASALNGWVPRKRLAMLTPLPPKRSGIADYNALFLPYLARYFDIDLYVDGYEVESAEINACFRIFDVADFERVAMAYDGILYEFGNSEFHVNMLRLIERFPGIVGLHDAYLSGLIRYVAAVGGQPHQYRAEMLQAHGPRARRLFISAGSQADADHAAILELPCTKGVLDRAIGLISHSPFNLNLARENFPEGWLAPYRTISQMVVRPPAMSAPDRIRIRAALGFRVEDFVIVTFGHVVWTKWGDRLLDALLQSRLREDRRVHLVFAGELSQDAFGATLQKSVANARLGKRVRITGYLSKEDYEAFLSAADLAVQLRTMSRGGTPKAVLDCMASRVPVIVNNDASYKDYPDNVVMKLSAVPAVEEVARILERALVDSAWRAEYVEVAQRYVEIHHSATACAAEYAAAIGDFIARDGMRGVPDWIGPFAPHLAGCRDPGVASERAETWLKSLASPTFSRRRIFIDVSHIAQSDHRTGIQRVVREIVRALYRSRRPGLEPMAVELVDGTLRVARDWLSEQGLLLEHEREIVPEAIEPRAGDVLLMLDSSWERYREFYPSFERARAARVPVITVVYDLLPITLPPGCMVEGGKEWFTGWLREAIASSDSLVCISRSTAKELLAFLKENNLERKDLKVGYWHLGADFEHPERALASTASVRSATSSPFLLMIGTVEPRKCHALAVAAMETLWSRGSALRLVIAGKQGWMVDEFMEKLRNHPQLGNLLHLLEQPSDSEIAHLYAKASALLLLSKGEGFGLPLVEAATHGTRILCSDLPVFHEIAGDAATYVTSTTAVGLADELAAWLERLKGGLVPDSRKMSRLTWEQSADRLLDVVIDGSWCWLEPGINAQGDL